MIAADTNILVYAHRADSEWHSNAATVMSELANGRGTWAIPWPCIHEFLAIATHSRIYDPPSTIKQAAAQVEAWLASPSLEVIGETSDHWIVIKPLLIPGQVKGPMVHDARIAAICIAQGVTEFLTADRDFSRFPKLTTRNPLLTGP